MKRETADTGALAGLRPRCAKPVGRPRPAQLIRQDERPTTRSGVQQGSQRRAGRHRNTPAALGLTKANVWGLVCRPANFPIQRVVNWHYYFIDCWQARSGNWGCFGIKPNPEAGRIPGRLGGSGVNAGDQKSLLRGVLLNPASILIENASSSESKPSSSALKTCERISTRSASSW